MFNRSQKKKNRNPKKREYILSLQEENNQVNIMVGEMW